MLATDCSFFSQLIDDYCQEQDVSPSQVAAALAKMNREKSPLLLPEPKKRPSAREQKRNSPQTQQKRTGERNAPSQRRGKHVAPEQGMDRYRIEVGSEHGVKPGNIVGAIANEADISSEYIGRISIFDDYSTVDLPYGMPNDVLRHLQRAFVLGKKLKIRKEQITLPSDDVAMPASPTKSKTKKRKGAGKAARHKKNSRPARPATK